MDIGYPDGGFTFDVDKRFKCLREISKKYEDELPVYIGVELGLMPGTVSENLAVSEKPFDFIIGSTHVVDGMDPYYPEFWEGASVDERITRYFEVTLDNITRFDNYDVYGHLDYITRYVPDKSFVFDFKKHEEIIREILISIIKKGHGIEVNVSPINKGMASPNPCREIIKLYKELGGNIITIGSDAHRAQDVGRNLTVAASLLKSEGFTHYSLFKNRMETKILL